MLTEHPEIVNDGAQYDGWRFRAECRLAGKVYGRPFGVDVEIGPKRGRRGVAALHQSGLSSMICSTKEPDPA